ncbi:uncharacterized protein LOC108086990 isoform X6 [Drosophila ficusphila]|uniref:uncharacterized protein LOC108086990 isoform X6 n=1 Tax=Drosophila ficusphila TaxID=30025 RepID=UPI0007E7575D|nr:uncharacterized protein LOC108086990 isoform X6 [Drosophila ficusphila]
MKTLSDISTTHNKISTFRMCFCPTKGLKILLLVIIHITAGFNVAQVAKDISLLDVVVGHHHIVLIISLSLCLFILIVLSIAIYAAVRHHILILNVVVIILVLNFVGKLIILFVCICTEKNPDKTAAHYMFIISWFITFLCMALVTVYWIRLCDLAIENEQN